MRVVIVGGGMAGVVLARALLDRDVEPIVLERLPEDRRIPGPIMLPFQAFDALTDIGAMDEVRARGRDIAPRADGAPVAIAVGRQALMEAISRGVPVQHEQEVVALLRDDGRVVGARVRGPRRGAGDRLGPAGRSGRHPFARADDGRHRGRGAPLARARPSPSAARC